MIAEKPETQETLKEYDQRYQQLYNFEATRYDTYRWGHRRGAAFNTAEQRIVYDLLGLQPGARVADVAAGTGRIATYLADQGLEVTAVDLTYNMLQVARSRAAEENITGMSCVQGNGRQLPFADGTFDGVISVRFFHLIPVEMHRPFILDMWRILKPGNAMVLQFNSAITAGGWSWLYDLYRRHVRNRKQRAYVWPHHIKENFADIENISVHGVTPIGVKLLSKVHQPTAEQVERLIGHDWRRFVANRRVFVRAVKSK
jgi:ubiquinone/menaquinone biosynthesis C-methylase UbiE